MSSSTSAAWNVDALPPSHGVDFHEYRSRIHETSKITDFLDDRAGFIVAAPKGFGKTLLLYAKRRQLEENKGYRFSPDGEMVERPGGQFPGLSVDKQKEYGADYTFWLGTWSACIMLAAVKIDMRERKSSSLDHTALDASIRALVNQLDDWTKNVLADTHTRNSPTDIFTSFFDADYSVRRKILGSLSVLNNLYRTITSQIAFFIDNVDEYFQEAQATAGAEDTRGHIDPATRALRNDIWTIAQLSLIASAFRLPRANSHIKIYCTIRQEALARIELCGQEHPQIRGYCVEIEYDRPDLEQIFLKNIALMKTKRLVDTGNSNPMGHFFGDFFEDMRHRYVSQTESAFDFLLRHSFYRPRDLITYGKELASIEPNLRSRSRLKSTVSETSDQIVTGLLSGMEPFFCLPDLHILLPLIKKNVMTLQDLKDVSDEYTSLLPKTAGGEELHPFCILARIGMLGLIRTDFEGERASRQRFVKPKQIVINHRLGLPKTDRYYLIHPALDHMLSERAGEEYDDQFHKASIIGNDCFWKEPATSLFVVKGDISGFSSIMGTEQYKAVVENLHNWVETACGELEFSEVSGGDSILLIDTSAERIVNAAVLLIKKGNESASQQIKFRFGGSSGPIHFKQFMRRVKGTLHPLTFPLGLALRTSARLEPHAEKDSLVVDQEFHRLHNSRSLIFREASPTELVGLGYDPNTGQFILQKHKDDPPHPTKLYFVELPS